MPIARSSQARLKRVFMESFSVSDIAEPLASFDDSTPAPQVWAAMNEGGWEVVGIRKGGKIAGYVKHNELGNGRCGDSLHAFDGGEIVPDSACLPEIVVKLVGLPWLFAASFGQVSGIVTRTDLQKPPVRMWLFGMIAIIEMGLTRLIQDRFTGGGWEPYLLEGHLAKAQAIFEERKRKHHKPDLLDCLTLSDKGRIALWDGNGLQTAMGFATRTAGEEAMKRLELLQYDLFHARDKFTCDWDGIVKLANYMDGVFRTC